MFHTQSSFLLGDIWMIISAWCAKKVGFPRSGHKIRSFIFKIYFGTKLFQHMHYKYFEDHCIATVFKVSAD